VAGGWWLVLDSTLNSESEIQEAAMIRKHLLIVVVVVAALSRPQAQDNPQQLPEAGVPPSSRQHGMVAAGHPLAAEAGMRILKAAATRSMRRSRRGPCRVKSSLA